MATFLLFLLHFCLLIPVPLSASNVVLELLDGWNVTNSNHSINIPASVPGDIYTDLVTNGLLDDPYYRFNDVIYRWVAYDNWTYSTSFQVPQDILDKENVFLVATGLDTACSVFINGVYLANTDNMFVRFRWPVKKWLKVGQNDIIVKFQSPVKYARIQHDNYVSRFNYDVPPSCPSPVQHGECHVNFLRKIQSSFSWDWGPAFPTMGIWQPIRLEAQDLCLIRDVIVQTNLKNGKWSLLLGIHLDCTSSEIQSGSFNISLSTTPVWSSLSDVVQFTPDKMGEALVNISHDIPEAISIDSWWPNGHGNQTLYNLTVIYTDVNKMNTSIKSQRIGFRTVELIQDNITDAEGLTYYFKVNGQAIFLKGSNWIPADSFPERITKDYFRTLLQSAADVHINGLRVWGGGQYEQDVFYEIADELGILIWQDMMFACAMYPNDPHYINSVKTEITQQICRLQHHPSILVWSGNNENEAALAENWYGTSANFTLYKSDYVHLYADTIMPIVLAVDSSRPFVMSSPSNGKKSIEDGYVSSDPQDTKYGDSNTKVHYYDYFQDAWDWKNYRRPRFASEYGFQSWPSFETLSKVSIEKDWDFSSRFMEHRQHHSFGNIEILLGIKRHMHLPSGCKIHGISLGPSLLGALGESSTQQLVDKFGLFSNTLCQSVDAFRGILYQTQIYQAMAIKTETEHYRRGSTLLVGDEGLTMGALYWQLNDIWQGASWASLEYGGKWKMLHYYAKRFFAPILVSPFLQDGNTTVFVINDSGDSISSALLRVSVYHWNKFQPVCILTKTIDIRPQEALSVYTGNISYLLQSSNSSLEESFFHFYITDDDGRELIGPTNWIFPVPFFAAIGLQKSHIEIQKVQSEKTGAGDEYFVITLSSDTIAPFVWLEAKNVTGRFSDNGFLMIHAVETIEFYPWETTTAEILLENLAVTSLMDLY